MRTLSCYLIFVFFSHLCYAEYRDNTVYITTVAKNGSLIKEEIPIIICKNHKDCNYNGKCASDNSMCICNSPYITVPANHYPQCNYKYMTKQSIDLLKYIPFQIDTNEYIDEIIPKNTINCTGPKDCNYNGDCASDNSICICNHEYITLPNNNYPQCNYHMHSQLTTFLLQFFFGIMGGGGMWSIGRTEIGLGQVLLFWIGLIGCCIISMITICGCNKERSTTIDCMIGCIGICVILASIIWNIILLVAIIQNDLYDSNGAPLYSW